MITTIVVALLPIVVTLLLGFFAGWHHDFSQDQAGILNKMVMSYALPLALFAGIITTPLSRITENLSVLLWIAVGMIGGFLLVLLVSRFIFRADLGVSALRAIAIAGPAVPFIGIPVLGDLYPDEADIAVAAGSLIMNIVQVPIALTLLTAAALKDAEKGDGTAAADGGGGTTVMTPMAQLRSTLLTTVKKSVVWAPILAFILIVAGVDLPKKWEGSFTMLGQATGGVALFAVGAVLFAQKIGFSWMLVVNVLSKNLILPGIILLAMWGTGVTGTDLGLATVTMAIPTASIAVIFAVEYRKAEREMATTLFVSTVLSAFTMGLFIWLTGSVL